MYLLWSYLIHMGHLRRLGRIREDHVQALMAPTATAIADLSGGSHKDRESTKRQQLTKLKRERLVMKMRRDD
jgi:hypothetical protein